MAVGYRAGEQREPVSARVAVKRKADRFKLALRLSAIGREVDACEEA
jgi:hypothetical protein